MSRCYCEQDISVATVRQPLRTAVTRYLRSGSTSACSALHLRTNTVPRCSFSRRGLARIWLLDLPLLRWHRFAVVWRTMLLANYISCRRQGKRQSSLFLTIFLATILSGAVPQSEASASFSAHRALRYRHGLVRT